MQLCSGYNVILVHVYAYSNKSNKTNDYVNAIMYTKLLLSHITSHYFEIKHRRKDFVISLKQRFKI